MKKHKILIAVIALILLCAVLFLTLARPAVRVVQVADGNGGAKWDVTVTALSFRQYYASSVCSVERLENGTWKACTVNPGMENVKTGMYLISLNCPGKKKTVISDLGFLYDLSAPGRYRVTVSLSREESFIDPIQISREFLVR